MVKQRQLINKLLSVLEHGFRNVKFTVTIQIAA